MAKITLTDVTSGYGVAAAVNANNTLVEAAIENTLSRDGTSPNDMQADFDMGGYKIRNLGAPTLATDAVRVQDLTDGSVTVSPDVAWDDVQTRPDYLVSIGLLVDPNADRILFWDDSATNVDQLTVGTGLAISTTTLALNHLGIESLTDPNADRILFWDDSAGATAWLTLGTNLSITGTTINAAVSSLAWASVTGVPAYVTSLGGLSDPGSDRIIFWDDSLSSLNQLVLGTGLTITGTTLSISSSLSSLGALTDPNVDAIVFWDDSASNYANLTLGTGLSITGTVLSYASTTGSFTGTLTGVTTVVTGTLKYSISGNVVALEIPILTGTSNSTAATITGLPAAVRPATTQKVLGVVTDNAVNAMSLMSIDSAGTVTLAASLAGAAFTASGTKAVPNQTLTYHLS